LPVFSNLEIAGFSKINTFWENRRLLMEEILQMTEIEVDRFYIIQQVVQKQITQVKAAELLGLKERQIRNLIAAFIKEGKKGLISKRRGKTSNRAYQKEFKSLVLALVEERYPDFGPTFAVEKLEEYHGIKISNETLRSWMIEKHLWNPEKKRLRTHPPRPRRLYFGELIQIDGSLEFWFEDRGQRCVLIVFIDDATNRVTALLFCPSESLKGYFGCLEQHITKYGRPRSLYSDRHSIFGGGDHMHHAQFIRALNELDIKSLLARSPQAKGRVERVNRTLQDRLIKEMRLRNISNIEDANAYLPEFLEIFNQKFSKEPWGQFDAHRPLDVSTDLKRILTRLEMRTVTKDLCISIHNKYYKILESPNCNNLKRQKVEVRETFDGEMRIFFKNQELKYIPIKELQDKNIMDAKEKLVWNPSPGGRPGVGHPWKKYAYQIPLANQIRKMEMVV
jgi:hypothetical protein